MSPCLVVLDQIEAIAPRRDGQEGGRGGAKTWDRLVSSLLTQLDGFDSKVSGSHVVLVATTRDKQLIEPALLRPGRLDQHILIGAPNAQLRRRIIMAKLHAMSIDDAARHEDHVSRLVEKTHGFCTADVAQICTDAAMRALREGSKTVQPMHFQPFA
eukprot:g5001.t1